MSALPPAPPHEDARDACCGICSSLFHSTEDHPTEDQRVARSVRSGPAPAMITEYDEVPDGYEVDEVDRLIGRTPRGT